MPRAPSPVREWSASVMRLRLGSSVRVSGPMSATTVTAKLTWSTPVVVPLWRSSIVWVEGRDWDGKGMISAPWDAADAVAGVGSDDSRN